MCLLLRSRVQHHDSPTNNEVLAPAIMVRNHQSNLAALPTKIESSSGPGSNDEG